MGDDRFVGALFGIGVGIGVVLLLSRRASAMSATLTRSPREPSPYAPYAPIYGNPYASRLGSLLARGRQGERWRSAMARNAPPGYGDPVWTDAVVRWIGIESGGDPTNVTNGREIGLVQIYRPAASEFGFTQDDLARYIAPGTSDDDRAALSWRYVKALSRPASRVGIPDVKAASWVAYMRHGLPTLFQDLAAQGFLLNGPDAATMDAAWNHYTPSRSKDGQGALRYASGPGGTPARQLLLRFVAAADAVAGYDRSSAWTPDKMVA